MLPDSRLLRRLQAGLVLLLILGAWAGISPVLLALLVAPLLGSLLWSGCHRHEALAAALHRFAGALAQGDTPTRLPEPEGSGDLARTLPLFNAVADRLASGAAPALEPGTEPIPAGPDTFLDLERAVSDLNFACLLGNLRTIQDDLLDMNHRMESMEATSQSTRDSSREALGSVTETTEALADIMEGVGRIARDLATLTQTLQEIEAVVGMINGVADQTHLLSLNASIEAAHVGAAGKGFAVVAEEIRKLSDSTKTATHGVSGTIERFARESQIMAAEAEAIARRADQARNRLSHFGDRVARVATATDGVLTQAAAGRDAAFLSLVKMDHFIYKQNGYYCLSHEAHGPEAQVIKVDHHQCRLGTWYERGLGRESFGHLPSFTALQAPHARVHVGIQTAVLALEGAQGSPLSPEVRQQVLDGFQDAEAASREVMALLDRLLGEKHGARA